MPTPDRHHAPNSEGMSALAVAYVDALQSLGIRKLIRNLATRVEARPFGDRTVVMTINRSEPTDTYVCSPHTAFVRYMREEIPTLPVRAAHTPLRLLVAGFDRMLRAARVDDIIHFNNWLVSTSLTGNLDLPDAGRLTRSLAEEFPDSILAMRSLNEWANGELIRRLVGSGWEMLPSRQLWVVDDLSRDWEGRRDTRRDRALVASTPLRQEELRGMSDADAARIAELYGLLYLQKYSRLNPDYSADFIKTTQRIGMLRYVVFRDAQGIIQSVAGCFVLGNEVTTPILGYDTAKPRSDGLYRLATHAIFDLARREGLRLNLSSGAAGFKKNRGARPQIEYWAMYTRHLSAPRRFAISALRRTLDQLAVPAMLKYEL